MPRVVNTKGHLGGDTGVIVLDGVRVRDDHRLGVISLSVQNTQLGAKGNP